MLVAEGANPDTCQHHLAQVVITMQLDLFLVCVSCASTIDNEFKDEFEWRYDRTCWKRYPKQKSRKLKFGDVLNRGVERAQAPADSAD